jgi:tetratricopeptide (TPR) repeat protein
MDRARNLRQFTCRLAVAALLASSVSAFGADGELTREQAVSALKQESADARHAGVQRLGEIGTMADVQALFATLRDGDENMRGEAERAIQRIWARSGSAEIDAMLARGTREMSEGNLSRALSTFNEIIRLKPEFAEGWNKRATLYFMVGEYSKSMKDCDEVLKRNPTHYGALAGYGQIFYELKNYEGALNYFQRALNINPNLVSIGNVMDRLERMIEQRKDGQI